MAAKDLIDLDRAKLSIQQITDSSQDTRLEALITAASDAIQKYCRREFYVRNYDEVYSGKGQSRLLLRQYPVQSVKSVRIGRTGVLSVQNTSTSTNQQARVQITSTGVTLTRVASGTITTNSLTFAGNVTLQALATAITALGNGWSAQVLSDYALWPSADLYVPPSFGDGLTSHGNLNARGRIAQLDLHVAELEEFDFDPRGWLVLGNPFFDFCDCTPPWPKGIRNIRVQYTAGYTTIPEAVQEACAEWVSEMYWMTLRDPSATSFAQTGIAATAWQAEASRPSKVIQHLLAPYRRHTV